MLNKIKNFMINAAVWTGALSVAFVILDGIFMNTTILDWLYFIPEGMAMVVEFFMMMVLAAGMLNVTNVVLSKVNIRRNRKYFTVAK